MKKATISGRLLRLAVGLVAPLIVLAFTVNLIGAAILRRQMNQLDAATLGTYADQLNASLSAIADHVSAFCASDNDVAYMQYLPNETERVFAKARVLRRMKSDAMLFPMLEAEFLYSTYTEENLQVTESSDSEAGHNLTLRAVRQICEGLQQDAEQFRIGYWQSCTVEERVYLLYLYADDEAYIGFLIDSAQLLEVPEYNTSDTVYVSCRLNGDQIAGGEAEEPCDIDLHANLGDTGLTLRMQIARRGLGNFSVWVLASMILLPLLLIALVLVVSSFIRKDILLPLNTIVGTMERVGAGTLSARVDTTDMLEETAFIGENFNKMLEQVERMTRQEQEQLKEIKRVQLRNLQMQINPHFLGNCFNAVYNAALSENTAQVRSLTTYLSSYFRYIPKMEQEMVTLDEELQFTEDFLAIQAIRFAGQFRYDIAVPGFLRSALVPTSVIKSFAENSVQYCRGQRDCFLIEIAASLQTSDRGSILELTVCDNGSGFETEMLEKLRQEEQPYFGGRVHIGIANVRRRLQLLYGADATLEFGNRPEGGAYILIRLPLKYQQKEDDSDDRSDRG